MQRLCLAVAALGAAFSLFVAIAANALAEPPDLTLGAWCVEKADARALLQIRAEDGPVEMVLIGIDMQAAGLCALGRDMPALLVGLVELVPQPASGAGCFSLLLEVQLMPPGALPSPGFTWEHFCPGAPPSRPV